MPSPHSHTILLQPSGEEVQVDDAGEEWEVRVDKREGASGYGEVRVEGSVQKLCRVSSKIV